MDPAQFQAAAAAAAKRRALSKSRIQLGIIGLVLGLLILVGLRGGAYAQIMALPAMLIGLVFLILGLSETA